MNLTNVELPSRKKRVIRKARCWRENAEAVGFYSHRLFSAQEMHFRDEFGAESISEEATVLDDLLTYKCAVDGQKLSMQVIFILMTPNRFLTMSDL